MEKRLIPRNIVLGVLSHNKYAPPGAKKLYNRVFKYKPEHVTYGDQFLNCRILAMYLELCWCKKPEEIDKIVEYYYTDLLTLYCFIPTYGQRIPRSNYEYLLDLYDRLSTAQNILYKSNNCRLFPDKKDQYLNDISEFIDIDDEHIQASIRHNVDNKYIHIIAKKLLDGFVLVKSAAKV
jgi:hypothetical protein